MAFASISIADIDDNGHFDNVNRTSRLLLACAFAIWEGFWLFTYLTAPSPDYEMRGPASVLFGGGSAILAFLIAIAVMMFRRLIRQRW